MIGLEYVRKQYNKTAVDIANELGVSRQVVSMWENGKKNVPEERAKALGEMFGISPNYFSKVLTEEDIADLDVAYSIRTATGTEYEDTEIVDGKEVSMTLSSLDEFSRRKIQWAQSKRNTVKLQNKIKSVIYDNDDESDISEDFVVQEERVNLFDSFADLVKAENVPNELLFKMIYTVKRDLLEEDCFAWGKASKMDNSSISADDPTVKELSELIKKTKRRK